MRLLLITVLAAQSLFGQNLVLNGSFENYINCPNTKKGIRFPLKKWYRIDDGNSTDYYNDSIKSCFDKEYYALDRYDPDTPLIPFDGDAFIGMYQCGLNFKSNLKIGYLEPVLGKLALNLEKDSLYRVSFQLKIPSRSTYNLRSFSLVFLEDSLTNPNQFYDVAFHELWKHLNSNEEGIAEFDIKAATYKRNEWIKFNTNYTATGKETYILLSFYPKFNESQEEYYLELLSNKKEKKFYKELRKCYTMRKESADKGDGEFLDAYFYIDDVKVEKTIKSPQASD